MEETLKKPRYEWYKDTCEVFDTYLNDVVVDVVEEMNVQDLENIKLRKKNKSLEAYIKKKCNDVAELVKENAELQKQLDEALFLRADIQERFDKLLRGYNKFETEKKSKTESAIQQLERVKEKFGYNYNSQLMVSSKQMVDFIDQIIKELKKEN